MFSNKIIDPSSVRDSNLKIIYSKLQSFLGRGSFHNSDPKSEMISARASTVASDESFITPVSSVGDLMAMSPRKTDVDEQADVTSDFLTGTDFDSICDVTMQEVPTYDDMFLDVDYLAKHSGSKRHTTHLDSGKDSLFVKFDPLYSRKLDRSFHTNTESVTDSVECDGGYETGSAVSVFTDVAPLKHTMSAGSMLTGSGKDRPTQVVPPVVNSEAMKSSAHPSRSTPVLVRSVSAILTPTQVATDRLISFAGTTPPTAAPRSPRYNYISQEVDRHHSLRHIMQKQDQDVLALRQENRELKSLLQDDQHKHSRRIEELEQKVNKLTEEKENLMVRENKLLQQINEKILSNKQMSIVMEEYEKTISSLIGEQQRDKLLTLELVEKLTYERDQALNHLSSMESSFNDLLSKYEKCKTLILEAKEREKTYDQKLTEYEQGIKNYESLYNKLKEVTSDNLAKSNETLDNMKKNQNVEVTKLNAIIKKHEITIASLHESVIQKTRDNEELTRICDQLINEVR